MPKNSPKSPDINIKRETKTRKDRPKPNPLIVYERLVRLERWIKFGHASLEPGKREKKKYCNFNEGGPAHSKTRYLIDYTRDRKSRWRSSPPRRLETKVGSNKAIIVLKLLPRYLKLLTASGIHPRDCNKGEDKTESVLQRVGRNFPTPVHRPDSKSRRFVH